MIIAETRRTIGSPSFHIPLARSLTILSRLNMSIIIILFPNQKAGWKKVKIEIIKAAIIVNMYRLGQSKLLGDKLNCGVLFHFYQFSRNEDEEGTKEANEDAQQNEVDAGVCSLIDQRFFLVVIKVTFKLMELLINQESYCPTNKGLEQIGQ